ncbi:hypothetical protein [Segeticoccus rhizosphaerae]|uniref:hypothetical protein n=1 Tax=Segeticoccus rhizosphaerae TaxID=1104777 RepID=UPI001264FC7F|nr:hypothetical protein [Segeticoccus rhizosphaerae]
MTIVSDGYGVDADGSAGSIDEIDWAVMARHLSAAPHVISGLAATVLSTVNRTVQIGTGEAQGWGVHDKVTAAEVLTFDSASVSTNPRWDAAVLHRDWQASDPTKQTILKVVKGTTNSATPVYPAGLAAVPGAAADHVLWLVPVTNTGVGTPVPADGLAYAAGSPLYVPTTPAGGLDGSRFDYGQLLLQYQAYGVQGILRRGTDAAPVMDELLAPPWSIVGGSSFGSGIVSTGRALRVQRLGDKVFLSGGVKYSQVGAQFQVDGGVDNNYELFRLPSWAIPSSPVFFGGSWGRSNLGFAVGQKADWFQVHVYLNAAPVIYLDNVFYRV